MELREQIIEATLQEFNEKGLKFTMDQLAKRLGISKKTLYVEFRDKETLFLEMVECCFGEIKKSERKIFEDSNLTTMEKLKQIIIVLPERYQRIDFRQLYELEAKHPQIYKKIQQKLESDWDLTMKLIEQAIEEGQMRPINMTLFKTMISASIEHFIRTDVLIKEGLEYQTALEEMIDILMKGVCV